MFDLLITGGTAVMPASTETADIGVSGGKIAAIGAPGSLTAAGAARTIDATGQIDVQGTMQAITNVVEGWVREYPEQWLWLHRRWR